MWPLTSHMPLRVSLVSPSSEWGQSLIYCLGLLAYNTYMPFSLGLVSHGAYALGLPKGKIQYMADLAQNGAETSLDGLWDLEKGQEKRQEASHYFYSLRGKRTSMYPQEMKPDSTVETP